LSLPGRFPVDQRTWPHPRHRRSPGRQRLLDAFETDAVDPKETGIDQLSNRELQVLRMIGQGGASRDIAVALGVSIKTIGTYCERIKIKLQLDSFRDLEALARDHVLGRRPT
jgi:DNA-binding CsgD family transcriptional regulator